MKNIDKDEILAIVDKLEKNESNWKIFYDDAKNYNFPNHSFILVFLLTIFVYWEKEINYEQFDITSLNCYDFYELLRQIDFEVMMSDCENFNVRNESIKNFYFRYLQINYLLNNKKEFLRTCKNYNNLFPNMFDDKLYKLLFIKDNLDNLSINSLGFGEDILYDYYITNLKDKKIKTSFTPKELLIIIRETNIIVPNTRKDFSLNTKLSFKIDNKLTLNFSSIIDKKYDNGIDICLSFKSELIQSLMQAIFTDYNYQVEKYSLLNKDYCFYQQDQLAILRGLSSIFDKIAYVLYKLFEIKNLSDDVIYFNESFFTNSTTKNEIQLINEPFNQIKALYLYAKIYKKNNNKLDLSKISIGNWGINNIRNTAEHKSTYMVNNDLRNEIIELFAEIKFSVLELTSLIYKIENTQK